MSECKCKDCELRINCPRLKKPSSSIQLPNDPHTIKENDNTYFLDDWKNFWFDDEYTGTSHK